MIVVDSNVIAYFLIQGSHTSQAREVHQRDPEWHAPDLWRHEFANVLAGQCKLAKLPVGDAKKIRRDALILVGGREHAVEIEDALELAAERSLSAYDAEFISLARRLNTVCVTEDAELRRKFPGDAISMRDFLGRPSAVRERAGMYSISRRAKR